MNAQQAKAVPELRFPEFDQYWPLEMFAGLFEQRSNFPAKPLPLYSLTIEQGVTPKSERYERSFLVKSEEKAYKKMEPFDFAYNPMNLRFGALAMHKGDMPVMVSKYYDIFFCNEKAVPEFMESYLTTYNMIQFYNRMATGSLEEKKRVHFSDFLKFKKPLPSIPEQQKIADFLSAVDKKIQQLGEKHRLLTEYKKGVMQQIFSQQIRFKDDNGQPYPDWGEKRLGELGDFVGGGTPSKSESDYWNGDIPWVSSSDIKDDDIKSITVNRFISERALAESATKLVPANSILFVSRVGVGKLAINTTALCTSQDFTSFVPKSDDSYFLGYFFLANKNLLIRHSQGTSIKGFTKSDIETLRLSLPTIAEQKKIAYFLSAIDSKIEQVSTQLEQARGFKEGLLQQMFV